MAHVSRNAYLARAPAILAAVLIVMLTTLLLLAPPLMSPASHTVSASVLSWHPQPGTPDPLIPIALAVVTLTALYLAGTIPARTWRRRRRINLFTYGMYHLGLAGPPDLYTCEPQRAGAGGTFNTSDPFTMGKTQTVNASYGVRCYTPGVRDLSTMATARSMPLLI